MSTTTAPGCSTEGPGFVTTSWKVASCPPTSSGVVVSFATARSFSGAAVVGCSAVSVRSTGELSSRQETSASLVSSVPAAIEGSVEAVTVIVEVPTGSVAIVQSPVATAGQSQATASPVPSTIETSVIPPGS